MRHILLSIALFFALTTQGLAQNLTKKEKIKTLFALMHQDSLVIKTIDGMTSSMFNNMTRMFNDTNYTKLGLDFSYLTKKIMENSMQKSKESALKFLNVDMVDIYDKYFTIEEIDDFSVFYKSKSAQKMLSQMPDISKDIMTIMSTKYQADIQQSFMKEIEEMTKESTEQKKAEQK